MALAAGTLLPFTLFAYGQSRVSPEVAGAFLNIEPLVGAVAGIVVFADPFGVAQAVGGGAIIGGIALSMLPLLRPARRRQPEPVAAPAPHPATPVIPEPVLAAAHAAPAVPEPALAAVHAAPAVAEPALAAVHAAHAVPEPALAADRTAPAVPGLVPTAVHVAVPVAVRATRAISGPASTARSASRVARSRAAAAPRTARLHRGFRHAPDLDLVHGDSHRERPCGPAAGVLSTLLMGEEDDREPLPAGCL